MLAHQRDHGSTLREHALRELALRELEAKRAKRVEKERQQQLDRQQQLKEREEERKLERHERAMERERSREAARQATERNARRLAALEEERKLERARLVAERNARREAFLADERRRDVELKRRRAENKKRVDERWRSKELGSPRVSPPHLVAAALVAAVLDDAMEEVNVAVAREADEAASVAAAHLAEEAASERAVAEAPAETCVSQVCESRFWSGRVAVSRTAAVLIVCSAALVGSAATWMLACYGQAGLQAPEESHPALVESDAALAGGGALPGRLAPLRVALKTVAAAAAALWLPVSAKVSIPPTPSTLSAAHPNTVWRCCSLPLTP